MNKQEAIGKIPNSLQKRIDRLKERISISKEQAIESYWLHSVKGYGASGVGYELFKADSQRDSVTFGNLAIDLGRFYNKNI